MKLTAHRSFSNAYRNEYDNCSDDLAEISDSPHDTANLVHWTSISEAPEAQSCDETAHKDVSTVALMDSARRSKRCIIPLVEDECAHHAHEFSHTTRMIAVRVGLPVTVLCLLFFLSALVQPISAHTQAEPLVSPTPPTDSSSWQSISYTHSLEALIRSIVVDCRTPTTIYASTGSDLLRSADGGVTWNSLLDQDGVQALLGDSKINGRAIAVSCQDPSLIFLGTEIGLLRSSTRGNSWDLAEIDREVSTTVNVQTVALDPVNSQTAYLGSWGHGIFKTNNGGDNWEPINEGLTCLLIHTLMIDPYQSETLYAGTATGGVFKSTNGGNSWISASEGLPLPSRSYELAADHKEPNTLYASLARVEEDEWIGLGVYRSTDSGVRWYPSSSGLPTRMLAAPIVSVSKPSGGLYTGGANGVYTSVDSGQSWIRVSEGLPPETWISAIAVDPNSSQVIYAGTAIGELFVSSDGGQSWTGLYSGMPDSLHVQALASEAQPHGVVLYLGTTWGVFRSMDGGLTWTSVNNGITNADISALATQPGNPSTVIAATSEGQIFRSIDHGQSWSLVHTAPNDAQVTVLLALRKQPGTLYAALETGGLLRSDDYGNSWHQVEFDFQAPVRSIVEDAYTEGTVYVATWGEGLAKSADGGETWYSADSGLESPFVSAIASDPHVPGILYAHVDRWGMFKSIDNGEIWAGIGGGIPITESVNTLVMDSILTNTLYVGTRHGIYASNDGGTTWILADRGLPKDVQITTVALDSSVSGNAYVGTSGNGLFRGNLVMIAEASSPSWPHRVLQEWLGLSPSEADTMIIALLLSAIVLWFGRRDVKRFFSWWILTLFRPSELFSAIRKSTIARRQGYLAYILSVLLSLLMLYLAFGGTVPNKAAHQIGQVPHLRAQTQVILVASVLSDGGLDPLGKTTPIISYIFTSFLLFLGIYILSDLINREIRRTERHNIVNLGSYAQTFTAFLFIFAYVNTTSLIVSATAAFVGLPAYALGVGITLVTILLALRLSMLSTKEMYHLTMVQNTRVWTGPLFYPLRAVNAIVKLPWREAISLLFGILFHPAATFGRIRDASILTVRDTRPYLVAHGLSMVPFWLLALALWALGIQLPEPTKSLVSSTTNAWSIWFVLALIASLTELAMQWSNQRTHPIQRKKPSAVYRWGALFRTLLVLNAAIDIIIKLAFLALSIGLGSTFYDNPRLGITFLELSRQVGNVWKIGLGVMAITRLYDFPHWNQNLWRLGQTLQKALSHFDIHDLWKRSRTAIRKPMSLAKFVTGETSLKMALCVFTVSVGASAVSGFRGPGLVGSGTASLPFWTWVLYQGGLLLFFIALAAVLYLYTNDELTGMKPDNQQHESISSLRYAAILKSLLVVVSILNTVADLAIILLPFVDPATLLRIVSILRPIAQMVLFGLAFNRMTRMSLTQVAKVFGRTGLAVAFLGVMGFLFIYWFFVLAVWMSLFAFSTRILSMPLPCLMGYEDLKDTKEKADAYLYEVQRPSKARPLYISVLELSKTLIDPEPYLKRIYEWPVPPLKRTRLLPIHPDLAATLVSLSSIHTRDALDYIKTVFVSDDKKETSWERLSECREAGLEVFARIIASEPNLAFENLAILIADGVTPARLEQIAQYLPEGILSEVHLAYGRLLAYDRVRQEALNGDPDSSIPIEATSYLKETVMQASSVFADARGLDHGEEAYLVYHLLNKSIQARFVRDLIAISLDYSQLRTIANPLFPGVLSALLRLDRITELLSRSEKVDLPDRLPYYAEMVELLDHSGRADGVGNLLGVERDAIIWLIVPQWKTLLLDRIKELKGVSSITVALPKKNITNRQEEIIAVVRNEGNGIAENVVVEVNNLESTIGLSPLNQRLDSITPGTEVKLSYRIDTATETGRKRVVFDISYDDLERQNKVLSFADTIEIGSSARTFSRLAPIPYVAGPPLHTNEMFFGRTDVFEFVLENLPARSQDNIILLHGERRTGKTSILYQLEDRLEPEYVAVLVDLQGMLDPGLAAFLYDIAVRIHEKLEEKSIQVQKPERHAFEVSPGTHFRDVFLKDATSQLGQRRLVLLVDEFEVLEDRVTSGDLDSKIFEYLRHLMQHHPVDFIFAGTYDVAKIAKDYWSVLFNTALSKKIELLSRRETEHLIQEPVVGYFEYDNYALEKIWNVTAGHPFFVQLLCRELVRYGNKKEIPYFTIQHVSDIIASLIERGDIHLGYIWDSLDANTKILAVILSNLLSKRGIAISSEIHSMMVRYGLSIDLDESMRELLARGIIQVQEGRYTFKIGLVGEWINATRDVESLIQ